jgi:hypothetical protein
VKRQALVPAAARHLRKPDDTPLTQHLNDTLNKMEQALGGRGTLLDVLSRSKNGTMSTFATLLMDPDNARLPLAEMCITAGVTSGDILRAYQEGVLLYAQTLSKREVAEHLPAVTKDVMERAHPQDIACPRCEGLSTILPKRTKRHPNPSPIVCPGCHGTGMSRSEPDVDRQKLALDLGEMLPKGSGVTVGVGVNTTVTTSSRGYLEKMQQAVSDILFSDTTVLTVPESPE